MTSVSGAEPLADDERWMRSAAGPRDNWTWTFVKLVICASVFVLAALPIALQDNLLLADYPEHLADNFIAQNLKSSAHLQEFYEKSAGYFPYEAIRLTVGFLAPLVGLETAVRWFATLAALMPAAGCCVLGWTLARRITLLPLAGLLFTYNGILGWGFLNYLFSGGFALMVFAAWVGSIRRPFALRLAALACAATILIWMHPFAAVLLGLLVCLWEAADWLRRGPSRADLLQDIGRIILAGTAFLPAGFSLILLTEFKFSGNFIYSSNIGHRISVLLSPLGTDLSQAEPILGGVIIAAVAGLLFGGVLRLRENFGRLFVYLMLVAFMVPITVFGVFNAGIRIPTFACMILAAGLQPGRHFSKWRGIVVLVFALLLPARLYSDAGVLSPGSRMVSELRAASAVIPVGSKVLTVIEDGSMTIEGARTKSATMDVSRYLNLDSYLIVDRQALVPSIFGTVGIKYRDKYREQVLPLGPPVPMRVLAKPPEDWHPVDKQQLRFVRNWRRDYDYILLVDFGVETSDPDGTSLVTKGSYFRVFKVVPPGTAAG